MSDLIDLASILDATERPSIDIVLPGSGASVTVRVLLRHEVRASSDVPRSASCWAPNKPALDFEGTATWAEYILVRLLERAGWDARWVRNWSGGRQFCIDVDQQRALAPGPAQVFAALHGRAAQLRGAGSWDVFAWSGTDFLFLESKQHRSSDRLNSNQIAWLEAAIDEGSSPGHFAIVEYDAGAPVRSPSSARRRREPRTGAPPPALMALLETVRAIDRSERIESRNAVAEYGAAAIGPMTAWLADDELRRFAIAVLEVISRTERQAAAALRTYGASGGLDSHLAADAASRTHGTSPLDRSRPSRATTGDEYMATGRPPTSQGSCGMLNGNGTACHNPGRHPVGSVWSCTTHYKAYTRRSGAL